MVEPQASNHSNQVSGSVAGSMVQAGTIQQVTFAGQPGPAGSGWVVPRQLPLAIRDFTGRAEYLAALDALLPDETGEGSTPGAVVISAVDGTGGIGKTTLAVHWAHRVQHRFPDGTLHVNLRGYGPGEPATSGEALDGFLRALGVPAERMPSGVEAQAALFRSLLAGRRVLIVLDNANSADQVRPLLPGSPGCAVVVTSRDRLTGLVITEGASRLTLDLLTELEAVELVRSILGSDSADTAVVHELVQRCARLPLALRIAATRAAQPHTTVEEVVSELADESGPLEVLSRDGDERTAVRAVFEWSYRLLNDDQARLFRLLGLHPGSEFSFHAAVVVADVEPRKARVLLDHLVRVHLLEPATSGRYKFHDLLRAYAVESVERYDGQGERDSARRALLGWYTNTAHDCNVAAYPAHPWLPRTLPPAPEYSISITDWSMAKEWLENERDNLISSLRYAAHHQLYEYVLHLADGMVFLAWLGNREELLDAYTYTLGLITTRRRVDREAEAWFRTRIGETLGYLQRWDEALTEFHRSLEVARIIGSRYLQAQVLGDLGWVFVEQRQFGIALPYLEEGLVLAQGFDAGRLRGVIEGNLSRVCTGSRQYRKAVEHGERELDLRRSAGDFPGEPIALHHVAQARQGLGEHHMVIDLCREAIRLGHLFGDILVTVAEPLQTLAVSLHRTGHVVEALTCLREAAGIYEYYGYADEVSRIQERISILLPLTH